MTKYFALPLLAAMASVASVAHAGDAATFRSLGFSGSGAYFAFADYGIADGSGAPYATVAVVDTAKNQWVRSKTVFLKSEEEGGSGSEEEAIRQAAEAVRLGDFDIKPGQNLGDTLVNRLPTDLSPATDVVFSPEFWAEGGASMQLKRFKLVLETKQAPEDENNLWCRDLDGPSLLTLSLINWQQNTKVTLQSDRVLPKSRACAYDYSIRQVIRQGNSLVSVIQYFEPGFEGPNVRHMVVTGKSELN